MKATLAILAILAISLVTGALGTALAAPHASATIQADVPLQGTPRVLGPLAATADFRFAGTANVPLATLGSYLSVAYVLESRTPVTVAVVVAGQHLATRVLEPGDDGHFTVAVPSVLLRPGANGVSIEVVDPACATGTDWTLTILPASSAHFALGRDGARAEGGSRLADFPVPFAYAGGQAVPVTIVLPHDPTPAELSAALTIAAGLGSAGYESAEVSIRTADQVPADGLTGRHSILIGSPSRNPWVATDWATVPAPGSAWIGLKDSAWAPGYSTLAITGEGEPLEWATRTIVSTELRTRLDGSRATVDAAPAEATTSAVNSIPLTGGEPLRPGGQNPVVLRPILPRLDAEGDITLELHIAGGTEERMRFNGSEIGAVVAPGGTLTVPGNLAHPGPNRVEIEQTSSRCGAAGFELLPGSALTMTPGAPGDEPYLPSFPDLPYPFSNGETYFVVPPDQGSLDGAAALAVFLGAQPGADGPFIGGLTPSTLAAGMPVSADLVLIDEAGTNPLVSEAREALPYYIHPGHALFTRDDVPVEAARELKEFGLVEFVPSPFNPDRSLLLISGTDALMLRGAIDAVAEGSLGGNIALVREGGVVTSMSGNTPEALSASNADDYPEDTIARIIAAGGIAVIALLVLQLVAGPRRKRAYR